MKPRGRRCPSGLPVPGRALPACPAAISKRCFSPRWLNTRADILLLDNPTQGIDVGAKAEVYRLILELARQGKTILVNTLEIPELQQVADRCAVFYEGKLVKILPHEEIEEHTVMLYSTNAVHTEEMSQ